MVSGDIVKVRIGDIVPADVEIIKGEGFNESALTGESLPVEKERRSHILRLDMQER